MSTKVILLGEIAVQLGDRRVSLGTAQPAQLLARLALSTGPVPLASLGPLGHRNIALRLRTRLDDGEPGAGAQTIETPARGQRALAKSVTVDVRDLRLRISEVETKILAGDPSVLPENIEELLRSAVEPFLPGLVHVDHYRKDEYFARTRAEHVARMGTFFERAITWAQGMDDESRVQQWLTLWRLLDGNDNRIADAAVRIAEGTPLNESIVNTIRQRSRQSTAVDLDSSQTDLEIQGLETFEDRLRQVAPGSTRHTVLDVITESGIYMAIPWRRLGVYQQWDGVDLAEHLAETLSTVPRRQRYLIVANPGSGKSTLAMRLVGRLRGLGSTPLTYIDLVGHKDERGREDFATGEWLRTRYGLGAQSSAATVIVDALDELLSGLNSKEIDLLLERELFSRADIVMCRRSYFERYLAGSPFAARFVAQVELLGLTAQLQDTLAERYLTAAFPDSGAQLASAVAAWLNGDPTRRALCATPLHLLLAVEAVSPAQDHLRSISDLVGLWQAHVDQVLSREAHRAGTVLDKEEKLDVLGHVAWHFYDEEGAGSADPPLFTRDELIDLLRGSARERSLDGLLDDVENHTLLTSTGGSRLPEPLATLHFTHRSLHMYFVARHLYRSMASKSESPGEAFGKFISSDVSRMLLEFISRLHTEKRLATRAVEALRGVIEEPPNRGDSELALARRRIARQQAAYYVGAIGGPVARKLLENVVKLEQDPWVSRGMAIALSLAGDSSVLNHQIALRRSERQANAESPLCDVNLGYHLSFAGDQPLDILAPDVDQGGPTCALTVSTLIRQLEMPEKRGSWRSTLFTFADLAQHRPASRASFEEAVRRDRGRLANALDALSRDSECRTWPELADAGAALDGVD